MHKLCDYDPDSHDESDQEHQEAGESEEMHRLLAEGAEEPEAQQVEESVDETLDSELALAVLALLVMDRFLGYLGEPGVLGQVWDVPVHLAVHLDVLDHFVLVGLEAAVHVVELDSGDLPCSGVVEL